MGAVMGAVGRASRCDKGQVCPNFGTRSGSRSFGISLLPGVSKARAARVPPFQHGDRLLVHAHAREGLLA